jgi:hypothetical protein
MRYAKTTTRSSRPAAAHLGAMCTVVATIALLLLPTLAHAATTPVAPADGGHLAYLNVNPTVAFDVPQGETPKWVIVGTDAAMANTVRYCRQFSGGQVSQAMMGTIPAPGATPAPTPGTAAAAAVAAPSGKAIITSAGTTTTMPSDFKVPFLGTAPAAVIHALSNDPLATTASAAVPEGTQPAVPAGVHWTCRSWSVGADAYGNDQLKPLEWNHTYFWQVVSTKDSDKTEVKSAVRTFTIDKPDDGIDPTAISDKIFGSVKSDGTTLNKGDAAFINSGLRVSALSSVRTKPSRSQIRLTWQGGLDLSRSYVRVAGEGTVRILKLHRTSTMGLATATWIRTTRQQKLPNGRYRYQAFVVSVRNGAMVKSELHEVVIVGPKQKASKTSATRIINL